MGINFNESKYYSIYEIAELHEVPVYLHTGHTPSKNALKDVRAVDPTYLEESFMLYPNVKFILGHMGMTSEYLEICLSLASKYDNVYLEISAIGAKRNDPNGEYYNKVLKMIKDYGLIPKVIYGSDGPNYPGYIKTYLERTLDAMDNADYSVDEAQAVLYDNFLRIYRLEEK